MFNFYQDSFTWWSVWPVWRFLLPLFVLLDVVLRGFALWRAARANQQWWFIALLVLNTMGILPAVYLFLIEPRQRVAVINTPAATKPSNSANSAKPSKKKPSVRQLAAKK